MHARTKDGVSPSASVGSHPARWMVFRAFLTQNVSIGSAYGAFGVTVLPLQEQFGASRGAAALGLALCVLTTGLSGPLIGAMITRIGLRWTMMLGATLSCTGYALLAAAPDMVTVLLLYALPIGLGTAMLGSFPSSVLASNWNAQNPGPALGITNMPLLLALLPMVGLALIQDHGLGSFYLTLAALHLLLLPVIHGVSDGPEIIGKPAPDPHGHVAYKMPAVRAVLGSPAFWAMTIGAGYLSAAGITGVSHLVAFAIERGIAASPAALLLSIMGGAAILGSLLSGMLCGRIGASRTLVVMSCGLCASWIVLLSTTAYPPMAAAALLIGMSGAGVYPAVNMLASRLFGQHSLPRILGIYGLATLPLTFSLPPLAGVLHDAAGGYGPVAWFIIGGTALVAILFLTMRRGAPLGRAVDDAARPELSCAN
jgi:MFS family permease